MRDRGQRRLVAVGVVVCFVLGASIVHLGQVAALAGTGLVGILCLIALVRAVTRSEDDEVRDRLLRWTLGSFGFHLAVGLAVTATGGAVAFLGPDAGSYHGNALAILAHWQHGLPLPKLAQGKEGFPYLLAGLYRVFGPYTLGGLALNAILSAALVPVVTDTARRLFGPRAARLVAPLLVLVPGLVVWGSQLLKEAPVLFLLAVAANCGVRLVERTALGPLLVLMATLPLLLSFRGNVGAAAIGGVVIGVAVSKRDLAGGAVTAISIVGVVALAVTFGLGSSGYKVSSTTNLAEANRLRSGLSVGSNSGFDQTADISTTNGAISYLPRGLLSFSAGPFPWELRGARQLVAVPDVLVWYFLIPSLVKGWRVGRRRVGRRPFVLLLPALTLTVMLSLVIGNYGTVVRERMQILVLLAPVIALGLSERRGRQNLESESAADFQQPVRLVPAP